MWKQSNKDDENSFLKSMEIAFDLLFGFDLKSTLKLDVLMNVNEIIFQIVELFLVFQTLIDLI